MTVPEQPESPVGEPTGSTAGAATDADTPEQPDSQDAGRDAARYRRQLRAAEVERDQLAERVQRMQRADVERLPADRLAEPADLWLAAQLVDLLDEAGELDAARLDERLTQVLADRPHWRRQTVVSFDGGVRQSATASPSFVDVLRGR